MSSTDAEKVVISARVTHVVAQKLCLSRRAQVLLVKLILRTTYVTFSTLSTFALGFLNQLLPPEPWEAGASFGSEHSLYLSALHV